MALDPLDAHDQVRVGCKARGVSSAGGGRVRHGVEAFKGGFLCPGRRRPREDRSSRSCVQPASWSVFLRAWLCQSIVVGETARRPREIGVVEGVATIIRALVAAVDFSRPTA